MAASPGAGLCVVVDQALQQSVVLIDAGLPGQMCADEGGRGLGHLPGLRVVMELSGQQLDEGIHIAAIEQLTGDASGDKFGAAIGAGGNDGQADGLCLGNDVWQSFPL